MDELEALKTIDTTLSALDKAAQLRSLDWLNKKYGVAGSIPQHQSIENTSQQQTGVAGPLDLSVGAIAQRLKAKTADDVLKAGACSLSLVHQREHFPWKDLLTEAGRATGYWTKYMPTNATKALKRLKSSDILVELANGDLALSPKAKVSLATQLGPE